MNENTVGFVRSLVGCQELSESVIQVVLTAAGANELLPDGNRKLAQLGLGAPGFVIDFSGALMGLSRGDYNRFSTHSRELISPDFTSKLKSRINSEKHRADIARRAGIDKYLNYNTRPGGHSSGVLALATSALIGAVYLEKKSFKSVINALYLLG